LSRLAEAVIPIDHVVETGRDFGQNNRARQISGTNGFRIQTRAIAIVGNLLQGNELNGEQLRVSLDEAQKPRDVEQENPVRVHLLPFLHRARLKLLVELELWGYRHVLR
jgi:hypothetical protein